MQQKFYKEYMVRKICKLLNWTEMQYNEFMYNCGRCYLIYFTNNDEDAINRLERSRMFWNWWKNGFALRDAVYLESDVARLHYENRMLLYLHMHDALALSEEIKPNSIILKDAFKKEVVYE